MERPKGPQYSKADLDRLMDHEPSRQDWAAGFKPIMDGGEFTGDWAPFKIFFDKRHERANAIRNNQKPINIDDEGHEDSITDLLIDELYETYGADKDSIIDFSGSRYEVEQVEDVAILPAENPIKTNLEMPITQAVAFNLESSRIPRKKNSTVNYRKAKLSAEDKAAKDAALNASFDAIDEYVNNEVNDTLLSLGSPRATDSPMIRRQRSLMFEGISRRSIASTHRVKISMPASESGTELLSSLPAQMRRMETPVDDTFGTNHKSGSEGFPIAESNEHGYSDIHRDCESSLGKRNREGSEESDRNIRSRYR